LFLPRDFFRRSRVQPASSNGSPMKRATLYSSSSRTRPPARPAGPKQTPASPEAPQPGASAKPLPRWRKLVGRYKLPLAVVVGALSALALVYVHASLRPAPQLFTQKDIDAAVLHTLESKSMPSRMTKAYEAILPSVVRVKALEPDQDKGEDVERGIGSGVVIVDKGIILTNMHVVTAAKKLKVVFFDGLESDAEVIGMQPENDLAVLQAKKIPDDLSAATLRSTNELGPGDDVLAVGFPFGIGPSATAGVISGLRREYRSPEGKKLLTNLIQFDAAANPGSSGGPLVTADGEVVGIVTAILNPTDQKVFIGIGFAVPIENAAAAVGMSPF
jgi:S1-C subfamily serine protease